MINNIDDYYMNTGMLPDMSEVNAELKRRSIKKRQSAGGSCQEMLNLQTQDNDDYFEAEDLSENTNQIDDGDMTPPVLRIQRSSIQSKPGGRGKKKKVSKIQAKMKEEKEKKAAENLKLFSKEKGGFRADNYKVNKMKSQGNTLQSKSPDIYADSPKHLLAIPVKGLNTEFMKKQNSSDSGKGSLKKAKIVLQECEINNNTKTDSPKSNKGSNKGI